jgi:hypothetical protein
MKCPLYIVTTNWAARAWTAFCGQKPGWPAWLQGIPNAHCIRYSPDRAVVVEGVTLATFVAGTITMLITGVLLNMVGLGIFCCALFALATHALPFFVGMTAGIYSFQAGAGPFGAIVVGFVTAGLTLVVGQCAFSVARSRIVRLVIGLLFAVPAARAGYDVTLALAHLGIPSEWWRESFAVLGAIAVGGTAWANVSMQTGAALRPGAAPSLIQPPNGATSTGG